MAGLNYRVDAPKKTGCSLDKPMKYPLKLTNIWGWPIFSGYVSLFLLFLIICATVDPFLKSPETIYQPETTKEATKPDEKHGLKYQT